MKLLTKSVSKPWGQFFDLAEEPKAWHMKIIEVEAGKRLSLQRHQKRSEFWIILEGQVEAQTGEETHQLSPKQIIFIDKQEVHRLKAITKALVAEITFGEHDENDIERLEDDYGRGKKW